MVFRQSKLGRAFLSSGIPLTAYLGYWQYNRWGWKLDLIEKTESKPLMDPIVGMPAAWNKEMEEVPEDFIYRRIQLTGKYIHNEEMFIYPRQLITEMLGGSGKGNLHKVDKYGEKSITRRPIAQSKLGANVITPFELTDGRVVLINRGYVGNDYIPTERRKLGNPDFEHTITGIIRDDDRKGEIIKARLIHDCGDEFTFCDRRNIALFAKERNTLPVWVDLDNEAAHPEGPIGGQIMTNIEKLPGEVLAIIFRRVLEKSEWKYAQLDKLMSVSYKWSAIINHHRNSIKKSLKTTIDTEEIYRRAQKRADKKLKCKSRFVLKRNNVDRAMETDLAALNMETELMRKYKSFQTEALLSMEYSRLEASIFSEAEKTCYANYMAQTSPCQVIVFCTPINEVGCDKLKEIVQRIIKVDEDVEVNLELAWPKWNYDLQGVFDLAPLKLNRLALNINEYLKKNTHDDSFQEALKQANFEAQTIELVNFWGDKIVDESAASQIYVNNSKDTVYTFPKTPYRAKAIWEFCMANFFGKMV